MKMKLASIFDVEQYLTDVGIIKEGYGQMMLLMEKKKEDDEEDDARGNDVSVGPLEAYFLKFFNQNTVTDTYTDVCI